MLCIFTFVLYNSLILNFVGDTALIVGSTKGHQAVVQTLLQNKSALMVKNRWGRNALHEACSVWSGPPDTVELLLLANMCPDIQVCVSPFRSLLIFFKSRS